MSEQRSDGPVADLPPPDPHLLQALRHAPDAGMGAPPALSERILQRARAALEPAHDGAAAGPAATSVTVSPPAASPPRGATGPSFGVRWVRAWSWLGQPRLATALGSLMVVGALGLLWNEGLMDQGFDDRLPAGVPAAAPAPATPPEAVPPVPAARTAPGAGAGTTAQPGGAAPTTPRRADVPKTENRLADAPAAATRAAAKALPPGATPTSEPPQPTAPEAAPAAPAAAPVAAPIPAPAPAARAAPEPLRDSERLARQATADEAARAPQAQATDAAVAPAAAPARAAGRPVAVGAAVPAELGSLRLQLQAEAALWTLRGSGAQQPADAVLLAWLQALQEQAMASGSAAQPAPPRDRGPRAGSSTEAAAGTDPGSLPAWQLQLLRDGQPQHRFSLAAGGIAWERLDSGRRSLLALPPDAVQRLVQGAPGSATTR